MEQWKSIPGFSLYEASTEGRIRNSNTGLIRKTAYPKAEKYKVRNRKRLELINDNGKKVMIYVHRLVAMAFIPNPNNLPCINHKDENGWNNKPNNLEWCTYLYNANYGTVRQRNGNSIEVYKQGIFIGIFEGYGFAEEALGLNRRGIQQAIKRNGTYKNYSFKVTKERKYNKVLSK